MSSSDSAKFEGWHLARRDKAEPCTLDMRLLHERGLLNPGRTWMFSWTQAGHEEGTVTGETGASHINVTLRYRTENGRWESVGAVLNYTCGSPGFRRQPAWFHCHGTRHRGTGRTRKIVIGPHGCMCHSCYDNMYRPARKWKASALLARLSGRTNTMPAGP